MYRIVVATVVVSACGGKSEAPQPPATCEPTLGAAFQRIAHDDKPSDPTVAERARSTMIASCESEHWSAEALACIGAARLEVDLATCTEKLTHEQYERLQRKLATVRGVTAAAGVTADAGVVVDAPPVIAPIDAAASFDAQRAPRDAGRPANDAGPRRDCSKVVLDARDRACVKQYCDAHPSEPRCLIE